MKDATDPSTPDFWDALFQERRMPWDAGGVPQELTDLLATAEESGRVLIPGCGAAYEAAAFREAGYDVTAIDFSTAAVAAAVRTLGSYSGIVRHADFFECDFGPIRFDVIYERAFLCSLPRDLWPRYVARIAELSRPGALLVGFFFFAAREGGPPFGLRRGELHDLLGDRFVLEADEPPCSSVPVFAGRERWLKWRRRATAAP